MYESAMRKASYLGIALSISCLMQFSPALAAGSPELVRAAIIKAKVLAPGTQFQVKLKGEQAFVSTFRNERASDKDCKIEALLVGKTTFETASDVTSVDVYFFNSKARDQYKLITVRTSDVKAFETGATSQEELLSSIGIKDGKVADPAVAIESRMMLSAAARADVQVSGEGTEELEVSCKMPPLSDDEYKFEAYRIAQTALAFTGSNAATKRVKVSFYDIGDKTKFKQVVISLNNLSNIEKQVATAFGTMQLVQGVAKVAASSLVAAPGALEKERSEALKRLQALEAKGVGVAPFVQVFQAMEEKVDKGDQADLAKDLERFNTSLSEQEKRYEDAKAHKIVKDAKPEASSEAMPDKIVDPKVPGLSHWAMGFFPLLSTEICRNPRKYQAERKQEFERKLQQEKEKRKGGAAQAENDVRYINGLMWFSEVLRANNMPEKSKEFAEEAQTLSTRLRSLQKR